MAACAPVVELHTGAYAEATGPQKARELSRGSPTPRGSAGRWASRCTRDTACTTTTYGPSLRSSDIVELNIGHAIVARAVIDGMAAAVRDMKSLLSEARRPGAT